MKANSINVTRNIIAMSKATKAGIWIGAMNGMIPNTHRMLKMLLPTMFPTARSAFFFNIATTQTTNSGREVPIAIMVADIKNSLNPSCDATKTAPPTTHFPPR